MKFKDDYNQILSPEISRDPLLPAKNLCKAILEMAVRDLKSKSKHHRLSARRWFFNEGASASISFVCETLDIEKKRLILYLRKEKLI